MKTVSHIIHKEYCVGFAFFGSEVILIKKARPDFQKGLLNGVGGKLELGENSLQAMVREFYEETNTTTSIDQWKYHGYLNDTNTDIDGIKVHVLYCTLTEEQYNLLRINIPKITDEPIHIVNIYAELLYLKTLKKLMYNIFDIIVELSDILYINTPEHKFKRYINNTKKLQERVVKCTL